MPARSFGPIENGFSLYLDLVRFVAALSVFIAHSIQYNLYDGHVPLADYGHDAVIVFFVLSGLVISTTAARPTETWKTYLIARASRIYSVAIPAIALCFAMGRDVAGLRPSAWQVTARRSIPLDDCFRDGKRRRRTRSASEPWGAAASGESKFPRNKLFFILWYLGLPHVRRSRLCLLLVKNKDERVGAQHPPSVGENAQEKDRTAQEEDRDTRGVLRCVPRGKGGHARRRGAP